jgi:hypothetical protein
VVSSCKLYKRFCPIYVNIPGKLGIRVKVALSRSKPPSQGRLRRDSSRKPAPGTGARSFGEPTCHFCRNAKLGSDEPFEEKVGRLTAKLGAQFADSARLEKAIQEDLQRLSDEH